MSPLMEVLQDQVTSQIYGEVSLHVLYNSENSCHTSYSCYMPLWKKLYTSGFANGLIISSRDFFFFHNTCHTVEYSKQSNNISMKQKLTDYAPKKVTQYLVMVIFVAVYGFVVTIASITFVQYFFIVSFNPRCYRRLLGK
ncbi:hypothetical protein NL108_002796 [Boleophthalmus pectinirostris]|nr:hypothetical protein NL108_002796 [Boleophthalmus pectinirostris]